MIILAFFCFHTQNFPLIQFFFFLISEVSASYTHYNKTLSKSCNTNTSQVPAVPHTSNILKLTASLLWRQSLTCPAACPEPSAQTNCTNSFRGSCPGWWWQRMVGWVKQGLDCWMMEGDGKCKAEAEARGLPADRDIHVRGTQVEADAESERGRHEPLNQYTLLQMGEMY